MGSKRFSHPTNCLKAIVTGTLVVAYNAAGALLAQSTDIQAPTDWSGIMEKTGTVGILVWMVYWFQKRSDADKEKIADLAERAITALDKASEVQRDANIAQKEVVQAIGQLKEAIKR